MDVIAELTIWHYMRIETHVKDAIATRQNVTLWANWRSRRSRYNEFNSIEQIYMKFQAALGLN